MKIRCNGLVSGGMALLIITSLTLGLFIGLLDPVEIGKEAINETLFAAENWANYVHLQPYLFSPKGPSYHNIL